MKKEQILSVVRHTLTFFGGLLVMRGYFEESVLQEIIGGIITLTSAIWSVVDKLKKS